MLHENYDEKRLDFFSRNTFNVFGLIAEISEFKNKLRPLTAGVVPFHTVKHRLSTVELQPSIIQDGTLYGSPVITSRSKIKNQVRSFLCE